MNPIKLGLAVMASALAVACGSIQPARMDVAPALSAGAERIEISGIGGGRRGSYVAGMHAGAFQRSADRLQFGDIVDLHFGGSSFSIAGPEIDNQIDAKCSMRERTINIGIVTFDPKKMSYQCDFTHGGNAIPARFEIQEVRKGMGGMLSKEERRGEIALDREIVQIQSVHKLVGSAFDLATPIGYEFTQGGAPIGAVELNGKPLVYVAPGLNAAQKRAVLVGALALAVFWDPAQTDPEI